MRGTSVPGLPSLFFPSTPGNEDKLEYRRQLSLRKEDNFFHLD